MANQRLLAVDDEPFNLEIITEYFDGSGLTVDTAGDGEEAWRMIDGGTRYSAILLDRMMPILDGMGLLRKIKTDERFRDIPVIMQTAAGNPEQVREGLAAGAYYYLVKPYERDSLLSIVRGALADASARSDLQGRLQAHTSAIRLLNDGSFSFSTIEEAGNLAAFLAQTCPQPDAAVLALSELLINAVEHGNLGISYAEKSQLRREERWDEEIRARLDMSCNADKRVSVALQRSATDLSIRIVDMGAGFDWQKYLDFDPARAFDPNGRGIALARLSGVACIEYEGCGNVVTFRIQS